MKRIRKLLVALAIAANSANQVHAGHSIEGFAGDKSAVIDLKTSREIVKDLSLKTRAKFMPDYHRGVGTFGLVNATYGHSFGPAIEFQMPTAIGILSRYGAFIQGKTKDIYGLLQATGSSQDLIELMSIVDCTPKIKKAEFDVFNQSFMNLKENGKSRYKSTNRIGLKIKDYIVGVGLDMKLAEGEKPSYNVGLFVKANF